MENTMKLRMGFLAGLLGLIAGCGSSYSSPSGPTPPASPAVGTPVAVVSGASTLTTTAYAPNPITISVGGTATWTNSDSTPHTSTGNDGSWNSGAIAPGASFSRTFAAAGSFPYHCTIHPGMVGTVVVQ
jgi:plastocyanin